MREITWTCLLASTLVATAADYPLKPVPFHEVEMTSAFWRPRLETQRTVLVPFAFGKTEPGVAHLQAAADALAGKKTDDHRPHRFIDSDLYKVMEGAAYLAKLRDDPKLEAKFDAIVDVIAAAQESSGYLYPSHTTGVGAEKDMMGDKPYEFVVHSHELYNMGHMYEAAIAYYQATGKDKLLKVAEKNAVHVNKVFFEGDLKYNGGKPIQQAPGHQEMELALVKLYRVTGKQLYLDMARKFLEIRGITYVPDGEGVMSPTYAQQHRPVAKQTKAVGHAVRATYLYSGMADVGVFAGKTAYAKALDHIWANITDTRMHITGGLGAVHGIEGFGPEYELPNADAFNETCAAVGNVLFNYRMFLLHKDAKYLDVAEVALLNNVLAAVNLAGNRFFYVNPLATDGKYPFNHGTAGRAPWFGTACCPSNMARLLPQVQGMTYAHDGENLYVTFFAESATTVKMGDAEVGIRQATAYPNDGKIRINFDPTKPVDFALRLRIPTWAGKQFVPGKLYQYANAAPAMWTLKVNGKPVEMKVEKGFTVIERTWKRGDQVELNLPMPVRLNTCHPKVEANHDRVALTRGPFVLCAEGVDNGGVTERYFFDQLPKVTGASVKTLSIESGSFIQTTVPAQSLTAAGVAKSQPLVLTPYYAWNNRGPSSMTVWFPRKKTMAVYDPLALPKESVFKAITATHTSPLDTVNAMGDGLESRWSSGNKVPRWTSRGQEGKPQTVTATFHGPKKVRSIGVFWMDHYQHPVKFPKEWKIETLRDGQWKPFELYTTDHYDTRANQYNVVHPAAPLTCDAIRIHMTPRDQNAMGILEMKVVFEK